MITRDQQMSSKPAAKWAPQTAGSQKKSVKGKEKAVDDSAPAASPRAALKNLIIFVSVSLELRSALLWTFK